MNSVVSVNVGLPRDVEWQGKLVHTAIWKKSVPGRVMARRLNLDGDVQGDLAGHGGEHRAVMVYQLDSYRYWQDQLQRQDFEYGQFGENLTVDGLPDNEVCIGDRYQIGSALFEITQPRVTCYRVGIRMANPQMPSLLVSHKRPGFYLRVLQEGEISAGDKILKVAEGPEQVTVAEVDALLYLPGRPREYLQRALRIPALSPGWKGSLQALVAEEGTSKQGNAGLVSTSPPPAWRGFRPLRVAAIQPESADVRSFVLESEDRTPLPSCLAGQFLVFKLQLDPQAAPTLRSYSMSGPPGTGTYPISIKRAEGPGSRFFHDHYSRIHSEAFGTESAVTPGIAAAAPKTPHPPAGSPGASPKISFTRSGLSVPWDPRFQSLLEFAEACDVPVRWSCRAGVCHMCESGLIDGEVRYAPEPLDRPADGNVLLCCSTPLSATELDL